MVTWQVCKFVPFVGMVKNMTLSRVVRDTPTFGDQKGHELNHLWFKTVSCSHDLFDPNWEKKQGVKLSKGGLVKPPVWMASPEFAWRNHQPPPKRCSRSWQLS